MDPAPLQRLALALFRRADPPFAYVRLERILLNVLPNKMRPGLPNFHIEHRLIWETVRIARTRSVFLV
jgi:hypothetical protein